MDLNKSQQLDDNTLSKIFDNNDYTWIILMIFQEGVGIQCSLTMIDLIQDNRLIVDCMREKDINLIVKLLSQIKVNKFNEAQ